MVRREHRLRVLVRADVLADVAGQDGAGRRHLAQGLRLHAAAVRLARRGLRQALGRRPCPCRPSPSLAWPRRDRGHHLRPQRRRRPRRRARCHRSWSRCCGDGRLRELEAVVATEPHGAAFVAGAVPGQRGVLVLTGESVPFVAATAPAVLRGVARDRRVEHDEAAVPTRGVVHATAVGGCRVPRDGRVLDDEALVEVVDVEAAARAVGAVAGDRRVADGHPAVGQAQVHAATGAAGGVAVDGGAGDVDRAEHVARVHATAGVLDAVLPETDELLIVSAPSRSLK